MAPVIITLVRHGESKDNLTALWAGQRDAPLTNHGYNQATRLGEAFKDVPITAIYASDLKRANTTARKVWEANQVGDKPPFTTSPLLREQFFGEAEGAPWDAGRYSSAHLPWEDHRAFRLAPNAESLNDVAHRADLVLRHFVIPHVLSTASVPSSSSTFEGGQHHILLVAHGIWLSEMLFALKRAGDPTIRFVKQGGYQNTAWSRIEVELDDSPLGEHELSPEEKGAAGAPEPPKGAEFTSPAAPSEAAPNPPKSAEPSRAGTPAGGEANTVPSSATTTTSRTSTDRPPLPEEIRALLPTLPPIPPRDAALPPPWAHADDFSVPPPKLRHRVVAFNQGEHLVGLKRTGAGVESGEWDEKQRGLKEFFAGGGGGEGEKKE
ncbi:hypothetical protein JCM6882_001278 [Rhodosporidiobolus microsporus]